MKSNEISPQKLEPPDSPTGIYETSRSNCVPIQHPQLTKIQIELHPPSPVKLAKDAEQPQNGQIEAKTRKPPEVDNHPQGLLTVIDKEVSLSLASNPLILRRANKKTSDNN